MTRAIIACVALALSGCVGSLSGPRSSDPRCIALDDHRGTLAGIAQASAPASGALGGISAIPGVSTESRLVLAGGALVAASVATYAAVKGTSVTESWARECTEGDGRVVIAPPPGYGNRVVTRENARGPLPGPGVVDNLSP